MESRIHISYRGLVRNVIGCREEELEITSGTTVGELRSTALVCVNDCDIAQLEGFETWVGSGQKVSVVVGVYSPEGG